MKPQPHLRNRNNPHLAIGLLTAAALLNANSATASSFTAYHDRASFIAALASAGLSAAHEDYESYAPATIDGTIPLGEFNYGFNQSVVEPAVVSDGAGGQALGGYPFDVFVGGNIVGLNKTDGINITNMRAFGADFIYAPTSYTDPVDFFNLATGLSPIVKNGLLSENGGSLFLGIIGNDADSVFINATLSATENTDPNTGDPYLVPAFQIDNLIYVSAPGTSNDVPEPATYWLLLLGFLAVGFKRFNLFNLLGKQS